MTNRVLFRLFWFWGQISGFICEGIHWRPLFWPAGHNQLEHKLVSHVVPKDKNLKAANEIAREIADNTSAVSFALSRHLMWSMLGASHPMQAHILDSKALFFMGASADAREGIQSFLEKRPSNFVMSPSRDMPDFYPWWKSSILLRKGYVMHFYISWPCGEVS